jgi:hypothetical protein
MEPSVATREIAAEAARLVVETGLEYAAAKSKAARNLGRGAGGRVEMPANELVEDEVRAYLEIFCADTQPQELAALRAVAAGWMERLSALRPHLAGAVWRGTATRMSNVRIELYCDDPKAAELQLLDLGVPYEVDTLDPGGPRPRDVLTVSSPCRELGERVTVHLLLHDYDELRGALKPDARGRTWRGDLAALNRRLQEEASPP